MRGVDLMEKFDVSRLKELETILVKDIMRPVHDGFFDAETPIVKIIELMISEPKRRVFYVVHEGKLIGVITPIHLLEFIALKAGKIDILRCEEETIGLRFLIGTIAKDYIKKLVAVKPEDTVAEACRKMVENLIDEIPVVSEDGRLIGELSFVDILNIALQRMRKKAGTLTVK